MADINEKLWKPVTDLSKTHFENEMIPVSPLFFDALQRGASAVRGRVFVNCALDGPGVVLVGPGVHFGGCRFDGVGGDVRKALYRPMSEVQVSGALPFEESAFDGCVFRSVGFTGTPATLDYFLKNFPTGA